MSDIKTVLIADDEADARAFAEAVISEVGDFNIIEATDGEEAVAVASTKKPDLIVLDVMMPRKSGFTAFNELRSQPATAEIPIIMLTGVSADSGIKFSKDTMGEYFGKAPEDFIDKPIDPVRLQAAVRSALGL
jgi:CheY-like chemotaxis protein